MEPGCNVQNQNIATIKLEDIHTSWIETLPNGKLIRKLIHKSSSNSQLIEYITQQFVDIKSINIKNCSETMKLIQTSHISTLNNIILMAGAAQFSKRFSRTINQQDVRTIKDSLGEDIYKFSLYEAPLSFPDLLKLEDKKTSQIISSNPFVDVISAGYRSFRIALDTTPNNCRYKVPKEWEYIYLAENTNVQIDKQERLLHMKLIFSLFEKNKTHEK
jgi:hypothetical protein